MDNNYLFILSKFFTSCLTLYNNFCSVNDIFPITKIIISDFHIMNFCKNNSLINLSLEYCSNSLFFSSSISSFFLFISFFSLFTFFSSFSFSGFLFSSSFSLFTSLYFSFISIFDSSNFNNGVSCPAESNIAMQ